MRKKVLIKLPKLTKISILVIFLLLLVSTFTITFILVSSFNNQKSNRHYISEVSEQIKERCYKFLDPINCYGEQLAVFNKNNSIQTSLEAEAELEKLDPRVTHCHTIAHKIVSSEIQKNPDKWLEIFKYVGADLCNGGYIHGVIEAKQRYDNTFQVNSTTIPIICQQVDSTIKQHHKVINFAPRGTEACTHTMGHLILVENYGDIDKSISICKSLPPPDDQSQCLDGLFMENTQRDNLIYHGIASKVKMSQSYIDDLGQLCHKYDGIVAISCSKERATIITEFGRMNLKYVTTQCYLNQSGINADECYIRGMQIISISTPFNLSQMQDSCKQFDDNKEKIKRCFSKVILTMLSTSTNLIPRSITLCSVVDQKYKSLCFSEMGVALKELVDPKKRLEICQDVESAYRDNCTGEIKTESIGQ